jgi:hypothetical protein
MTVDNASMPAVDLISAYRSGQIFSVQVAGNMSAARANITADDTLQILIKFATDGVNPQSSNNTWNALCTCGPNYADLFLYNPQGNATSYNSSLYFSLANANASITIPTTAVVIPSNAAWFAEVSLTTGNLTWVYMDYIPESNNQLVNYPSGSSTGSSSGTSSQAGNNTNGLFNLGLSIAGANLAIVTPLCGFTIALILVRMKRQVRGAEDQDQSL